MDEILPIPQGNSWSFLDDSSAGLSVNDLTVSTATQPISQLDIRSRVPGSFAWTTSATSASTSTTWRTTYQIGLGWEEAGSY